MMVRFSKPSDLELQELLHLRHVFAFQYLTYTDVQLFEILERDGRLDRISLVSSCFVQLLDVFQTLHLSFDGTVFDLVEQQGCLAQLMTGLQQVGTTQLSSFEAFHIQHLAEFFTAEWQERFECNSQVSNQLQ